MNKIFPFLLMLLLSAQSNAQQLLRQELASGWKFTQSGLNEWLPATVPGTVQTDLMENLRIGDPFYRTVEHDVQWIDKVDWIYRDTFDLGPAWLSRDRIQLVFEGLDTHASVMLNGRLILESDNMFLSHRVDVKGLIREKGNVLEILFRSAITEGLKRQEKFGFRLPAINDQSENGQIGPNKVSIFTRKAGYHFGWDWGPRLVPSGIWRPVYAEAWNLMKINDIFLSTIRIKGNRAEIKGEFSVTAGKAVKATLTLKAGPEIWLTAPVELIEGENHISLTFTVRNPELWWPNGYGRPHLYDLTCTFSAAGMHEAFHQIKTGIRTVRLVQDPDPDGNGRSFYFEINGVPVFAKGANYIPSDAFTPRLTTEDYRKIVESASFANMNMLRVWGGGIYENDIFYDLCDEKGIMVWQDFMFACSMYPGNPEFLASVAEEARQNIIRLRNHPSVVLWCGNNEIEAAWGPYNENMGWGWKQRYNKEQREIIWNAYDTVFHHILPQAVNTLTPSLPYWHSSPSAGMGELSTNESRSGDIHYWGVWHMKHPFEDFNKYVGRFMSEYGFQSFPEFDAVKRYTVPEDWDIESPVMSSHQRSGIGNVRIREYMEADYHIPQDFSDFLYVSQLLQAEGIKEAISAHRRNKPYCMGTLYWQLNDCWPVASWSSTDFYRNYKALHYFVRKAFEPVAVMPHRNGESIDFHIVSDLTTKLAGTLLIRSMTFDGKPVSEKKVAVLLAPLEAKVVGTVPVSQLAGNDVVNVVVVEAVLRTGNKEILSEPFYLVKPKDLALPQATLKHSVKETETGWIITVSAEKLVKNLMITWNGRAGIFSDNYFDILPGRTVSIRLAKELSTGNPEAGLGFRSLAETLN